MKVFELKKELDKCPDNAEIGFEHLKITYVCVESDNYVDLGGSICKIEITK